jgi:hypothetical protein
VEDAKHCPFERKEIMQKRQVKTMVRRLAMAHKGAGRMVILIDQDLNSVKIESLPSV